MKKNRLNKKWLIFALIISVVSGYIKGESLVFPINFEEAINYNWVDIGGATTAIVANPEASGINTSSKVSKVVKSGGEVWAGAFVSLIKAIDFSTYKDFKVKVYVPQVGTKVTLKLENADDNSIFIEVNASITKANEWEELTFNFAEADVSASYQKVVVFFDLGTVGDGTAASTYYLDDIDHPGVDYGNNSGGGDVSDTFNLDDYTLIWADEFNTDGALDDTKWFLQTQLPAGGSWFNGEVQHYTDRTENSYVVDGVLKLVAKKESFTDQGVTKEYTSARLNSKFAFTYGRVEVKAKLPSGVGTWPAIWMLGKNINESGAYWETQGYGTMAWPACGEIDIMEHWGHNENVVSSAMHTPSSYGGTINTGHQIISSATTEFHIYAMNWDADKIVFTVDGKEHYRYSPEVKNADTWPYDADQYLLFNIAIQPSISASFSESSMDIDYVRVYQKRTSSISRKSMPFLELKLYPNPTLGLVFFDEPVDAIAVFSISGRNVYELNYRTDKVDLAHLATGSYILKVEKEGQTYFNRILKK